MKTFSVLGIGIALLAMVAFAHAQCLSGSGEMEIVCIKSDVKGGESCQTIETECCKSIGCHGRDHHGLFGCAERFYLCCPEAMELTDAQMKRLEEIRFEHRKSTIRMRADVEIMELELKNMMQKPDLDRTAVGRKITEVGELRTNMKKDHVFARLDAKSVLTKEQLEKCAHGQCGCCGMGIKKVIEKRSCSNEGTCSGTCSKEGNKCEGHCK